MEAVCESLGDFRIFRYGSVSPDKCLLYGARYPGQGSQYDRVVKLSVRALFGLAFLPRTVDVEKSGSNCNHLGRSFCFLYLIIRSFYEYSIQ